MTYVIYNTESTITLRARARSVGCYVEYYKSVGAAKGALTRLDKKGLLGEGNTKSNFAIAELGEFRANIEKKVERINIISGKKYMESVNTPNCCSPSTETYWSM